MIAFVYVPHTSDEEWWGDAIRRKDWREKPRRVTQNPITKKKKKPLLSKADAERVLNRHVEENETIDIVKTIVMADIEKTEFCDG